MTPREKAGAALLAGAAVVCVLLGMRSGHGSELTLMERSVGNSYDPYVHWTHGGGGTWVHRYPQTVGANCLGQAVQNEDLGLSLRGVDVSGGGYSQ